MKLLLTLAALVLLASSASARGPGAVCYSKTVKCCFKYGPCGTVVRKNTNSVDCSFQKCETPCNVVCSPSCHFVKTKKPRHVCKFIRGGCERVWARWGWVRKCHKGRKICKTVYSFGTRKVCKKSCVKKCFKKCFTVKATCTSVKTTVFPKFCAKLACGGPSIVGNTNKPGPIVGGTAISSSVSKPVRTITGRTGFGGFGSGGSGGSGSGRGDRGGRGGRGGFGGRGFFNKGY